MPDARTQARFDEHGRMLANRVKKRHKHLKKRFARQNIEVFRLYDWDIPEIRAVVDWYAGHLVIGEYTRKQSVPEWLPVVGRHVADAMGVPEERLHLKFRKVGKQDGKRYERIGFTDEKIVMHERDLKFWVNPYDYVDTGLFSDHRNTRVMVREMAEGKDFLNLFCYTGAFTCYAAKGGAKSTTSVDRAETAISWVMENLELNGLSDGAHAMEKAHTLDFLEGAKAEGKSWDLAVVDPPSFSTIEKRDYAFDIARDHPELLRAVVAVMRPGGTVFFSTNHQGFELDLSTVSHVSAQEITRQTIPEDYERKRHPIHRCWRIGV